MAIGNPKIIFTSQNQAFDVTVNGLVPFTRHYVYFERQLQADTKSAPQGGRAGQALISNTNGQLSFTYYYSSGLPNESNSLEAAQALANTIAGLKELVVINASTATIDESFRTALSWARTFLRIQVYLPSQSEVTNNPYSVDGSTPVAPGI